MGLDPQARTLLDQLVAMGGPPLHTLSVPEARQAMAAMVQLQPAAERIAEVRNLAVPGPAGEIPIRLYKPSPGRLPLLVYFHGGGWVLGSLDSHDGVCRSLANRAECMVVSVDYRLAPEHKFPAAAEDAYAATQWVVSNADRLGGDPTRVAIGGDSAGANLTAVVALMARDRKGPALVHQLLVYPVTDSACDTDSYRDNADGYLLTRDAMVWFWDHYTRDEHDRRNPYAAPLRAADLDGLPPALVITAEFDPLRDEGEAYAQRLREAGVAVRLSRYAGMIHGFFGMGAILDQAKGAMQEAAGCLRSAFSSAR
jgi:acetyl esterase